MSNVEKIRLNEEKEAKLHSKLEKWLRYEEKKYKYDASLLFALGLLSLKCGVEVSSYSFLNYYDAFLLLCWRRFAFTLALKSLKKSSVPLQEFSVKPGGVILTSCWASHQTNRRTNYQPNIVLESIRPP